MDALVWPDVKAAVRGQQFAAVGDVPRATPQHQPRLVRIGRVGNRRSGDVSVAVKRELARRASPVTWVTKECAPLFIMHGTADPLVGLEQSQKLAEKLKAAGAEVTLDVVEGAGHGGPQFFSGDRPARLLAFFNAHLLPPKPAGQ